MIDLSTEEWKEALRLVQAAFDAPADDAVRATAFDFLRCAQSKRLVGLAHLLQPGATPRSIQAALVPLERVDKRARVTDAEMGIRNTDAAPGRADRAAFTVVADNVRSAFNAGGLRRVYALETADGATDIASCTPVWPCALLLGNERFGLDPDVVAMADEVLEIPSHGMKNSLNVVSAFAVAAAFFRNSARAGQTSVRK